MSNTDRTQPISESGGLSTSGTLLDAAREASPEAWQRLVRIYAPLIWHWCNCTGLSDVDRADIAQEVFQTVATRLHQYQKTPSGTFRGWLRTITRNKITDHHRSRRNEPAAEGGSDAQSWFGRIPLAERTDTETPDEAEVERQLLLRELVSQLRSLFSERTWEAFWRTAVDGRSAQDTATELGMTPGAVRVARCRVLQRLRTELGDASGEFVEPDPSSR